MSRLERLLVVPDAHHPYVDRRAWRVLLAAGHAFKPDRIVCLGDFGDFDCVSSHRKDPARVRRLRVEMRACAKAFDELDALGAKEKFFVFGNHEDRLARYIADNAPALHGLVSVEGLFELERRGWHVTPYGGVVRVGKTYFAHDPSGAGAHAHYQAGVKAGRPIVHGHTHRAAVSYLGNIVGEHRVAAMLGWLGNPDRATYVHKVPKRHDWIHAFGIGYLEPDGTLHLQAVPILRGRACVDGKLIAA